MWHKNDVHISRQCTVNTWHTRLNALNKRIFSVSNLNRMEIKCHLLIFHIFAFALNFVGPFEQFNYRVHIANTPNIWQLSELAFLLLIVDFDTLKISSYFVWLTIILSNIDRMCYTHSKTRIQSDSLLLFFIIVVVGVDFEWGTLHQTTQTKHRKRRAKKKQQHHTSIYYRW